jgi:quinoprotein glucose dehydrogenase
VTEVQRLLGEGFSERAVDELLGLLAHADQRVRQGAQFALAARGADVAPQLHEVAVEGKHQLARIHALWALGQLAEQSPAASAELLSPLVGLLSDSDAEIRAQAARQLGDHRVAPAYEALVERLQVDNPRVRFFAAMALGKLGRGEAIAPVLEMLRENADQDPYLRHAGVMALIWIGDLDALSASAEDASPSERMGIALAMRRMQSPQVARFLDDSEPKIVAEAARAICDAPIEAAMPELAKRVGRSNLTLPALRRAINANFRLGDPDNAEALAKLAARADAPEELRVEALRCLESWAQPSGRDRTTGLWRPLEPRSADVAAAALRPVLGGVFSGSDKVRQAATQTTSKLGIKEVGPELAALVADGKQPAQVRAEALAALDQLADPRLKEFVEQGLTDSEPKLRAAAQRVLAKLDPARAIHAFEQVLKDGSIAERQAAFGTLAEMKQADADALLIRSLDELAAGRLPGELQLDLLAAAGARGGDVLKQRVDRYEASQKRDTAAARFHESLLGGDAERGRRIFLEKAEVYCLRCHKLSGQGGEVGPDLSKIAADPAKTREYLLESIVDPNRQIAKGFDSVLVSTDDGRILAGVLKSEDERELRLMTPEGKLVVVAKDEIDERSRGQSAMPDKIIGSLSKSELRDLIEFLANLK